MGAGCPNRCTTTTARVWGVIARTRLAGSTFPNTGSTSVNTGTALHITIAVADADMEYEVTTTSSPGPQPNAARDACRQDVAEFIDTACGTLKYRRNSASNSRTF